MFKKVVLSGLAILIFSNFTGIVYGKRKTAGYLEVIYYTSGECGMAYRPEYRCYAPFHIMGNKIIGDFEIEEIPANSDEIYLVPLAPNNNKQVIVFSFKCPSDGQPPPREVSGLVIIHKVRGKVIKIKGKKMLHFVVRLSQARHTIKDGDYMQDISKEPWDDEFLAPFQDGYRTKRGKHVIYDYVIHLKARHK